MVNWDTLIAVTIILVLALGFWARISRQTIPELIGNIIERVRGAGEDSVDYATEIYE